MSCPALLVPTAADTTKTVKWPSTQSSDFVDKLAIGDVIKGSCVYDLADAPADAGVDTGSKGVIFVQVNAKAADAARYITETSKYLKDKKFTVKTQADGLSGSIDTDKDGTDDVAVTAAFEDKVSQDTIDGDGGEFYKIFGIKAGGSVLFGSVGSF